MAQVQTRITDWNGREITVRLERLLARRMLKVEKLANDTWKRNTRRPYPPASRPGQYPRKRTGKLMRGIRSNINRSRAGIVLTLTNIARSPKGFDYPKHLEKSMGRKGLRHMLSVIRRRVARILVTGR